MKWTTEKPTKPGYYWVGSDSLDGEIWEAIMHEGKLCWAPGWDEPLEFDRVKKCLHYGPLIQPSCDA